jgi:hypothetical protein
MSKPQWEKKHGGRFIAEVTEYKSATEDGYRAEFEVYKGVRRKVCEWMVWYPGGGQNYGICYDLAEVKKVVARVIKKHQETIRTLADLKDRK